jgi:hypothetical protein
MKSKFLKVAPLVAGTLDVLDAGPTRVVLPVGVEYFRIREVGGDGTIRWAWTEEEFTTGTPHTVGPDGDSGFVIANPLGLWMQAEDDDADYEVFCVIEGR